MAEVHWAAGIGENPSSCRSIFGMRVQPERFVRPRSIADVIGCFGIGGSRTESPASAQHHGRRVVPGVVLGRTHIPAAFITSGGGQLRSHRPPGPATVPGGQPHWPVNGLTVVPGRQGLTQRPSELRTVPGGQGCGPQLPPWMFGGQTHWPAAFNIIPGGQGEPHCPLSGLTVVPGGQGGTHWPAELRTSPGGQGGAGQLIVEGQTH